MHNYSPNDLRLSSSSSSDNGRQLREQFTVIRSFGREIQNLARINSCLIDDVATPPLKRVRPCDYDENARFSFSEEEDVENNKETSSLELSIVEKDSAYCSRTADTQSQCQPLQQVQMNSPLSFHNPSQNRSREEKPTTPKSSRQSCKRSRYLCRTLSNNVTVSPTKCIDIQSLTQAPPSKSTNSVVNRLKKCSLFTSQSQSAAMIRSISSVTNTNNNTTSNSMISQLQLERSHSIPSVLCGQHIDECIRARDDLQLSGDSSTPHTLPISRYADVNYISIHTLAKLIKEERHCFHTPMNNENNVNKTNDVNTMSKTTATPTTTQAISENMKYLLMDCRYAYEYNGGHIATATNISQDMNLDDVLQWCGLTSDSNCLASSSLSSLSPSPSSFTSSSSSSSNSTRLILILHCEFSSHRAPSIARRLRNQDRQMNFHRYPFLYLPEIYVMEGGYSQFFQFYPTLCEPVAYISMYDPLYIKELKQCREIQNPKKRTQL